MKIKQILMWIVGYEVVTWLLIAMALNSPRDPMDNSVPPTKQQVILMTHLYSLIFVGILVGIFILVMKGWKASNHRRR